MQWRGTAQKTVLRHFFVSVRAAASLMCAHTPLAQLKSSKKLMTRWPMFSNYFV